MILGFISDIHEDIDRLNEAIKVLEKEGCNELVCLGDIIGFNYPNFGFFDTRDASACISVVRANCRYIVAGNHDLFPVKRIPNFKAGFDYPHNWFRLEYAERKKLAGDYMWLNEENEFDPLIGKKDAQFLRSLPEYQIIEHGSLKIMLSHYLYPDLSGSTKKYYDDFGPVEPHLTFIRENGCDLGFSGHKHVEGFFKADNTEEYYGDFGRYELKPGLQWIIGPCIANGKKKNGCMVFNTDSFELNIIPLNTPPRYMETIFYKP